jgi:hypothetical protein
MDRTKYVLIERREGFKNTYTTEKAALDAMQRGLVQSYKPVTLEQIKQLGANEYREADYFRHVQSDDFIKEYNGRKCRADIVAWNGTEGLVKLLGCDLGLQTIRACNIAGKKTWDPETACVYYKVGETVDVELKAFGDFKLFVCGLTPGHFDAERWDSLDKSKLAFKCDENGKAINGLFATKEK